MIQLCGCLSICMCVWPIWYVPKLFALNVYFFECLVVRLYQVNGHCLNWTPRWLIDGFACLKTYLPISRLLMLKYFQIKYLLNSAYLSYLLLIFSISRAWLLEFILFNLEMQLTFYHHHHLWLPTIPLLINSIIVWSPIHVGL